MAGPPIPIELSSVAIITSAHPATAALPAKQYPPTIAILNLFRLNAQKKTKLVDQAHQ